MKSHVGAFLFDASAVDADQKGSQKAGKFRPVFGG